MKQFLCVALCATALMAVSTRANAQCCFGPVKINGGVKVYLKIDVGGAAVPLAPWYLYFPAEANLHNIGPQGHYPNWQAPPPAANGAFGFPPPYPPGPQLMPPPRSPIQRTSYQVAPSPAYWYGQ
jgi:hypothetical protein